MLRRIILFLFLFIATDNCFAQYTLQFHLSDSVHFEAFDGVRKKSFVTNQYKDSLSVIKASTGFIQNLYNAGFLAASIDSVSWSKNVVQLYLYAGEIFSWAYLRKNNVDDLFLAGTGIKSRNHPSKPISIEQFSRLMKTILVNCENNGYPFAAIRLDSIELNDRSISALLKIETNKFVTIDSVIIKGENVVAPAYLYNYTGIRPGSMYNESLLRKLNNRLRELPFITELKPADVVFGTEQTKVFLYLESKKASQFDGVIGFLPDNAGNGKVNLTGELHLKLQNSLRRGEVIDLNWKQLPPKSQDLKLYALYPYMLNTPIGIDGTLNIYKKDTIYLDVSKGIGVQYRFTGNNFFKAFYKNKESSLLSTAQFESATVLPSFADITLNSYGLLFNLERVDYRFNPRKGISGSITASTGQRTIKKNNKLNPVLYDSLKLKSTNYQLELHADYFIPIRQRHVINVGNQTGYLYSPSIFSNELFRIGGLKSLRGFDEESILTSFYSIGKIEYRYILELNSYLFAFYNMAYTENKSFNYYIADSPRGFGLGINFETKLGIMSLNYAIGKQFDNPMLFRNAKVHFGIVNYF